MTDTLKPCPFCDGTAKIAKGEIEFWAYCPHCGAKTESCETEQEALKAWNTRQIEDELDKKNGYLIGTCHDLHDIVEEFRAECGQKDLEIKRLREALESIKEMSSYLSAGEITIYDLLDIHNICCDALKGENK